MENQHDATDIKADVINGGGKYAKLVSDAIDEATTHIVSELDQLMREVEAMKGLVIANSGAAKAGIAEHFNLGTEATTMARNIRDRLHIIQGGQEGAKS